MQYWPGCPINLVGGEKLRKQGGWIERDVIKLSNGTPIARTEAKSYRILLAKESLEMALTCRQDKQDIIPEDITVEDKTVEDKTVEDKTQEGSILPIEGPEQGHDQGDQKERIWHARLGHPSQKRMQKTIEYTTGIDLEKQEVSKEACEACDMRRSLAYRSKDPRERAKSALDLIHGDTFQLTQKVSGKKKWGVLITDDYSRYRAIIFVSRKYEVFRAFTWLLAEWENSAKKRPKVIHIDGGTEFGVSELAKWAGQKGTRIEPTAPYQPSENPIAERANRCVFEVARGLRVASPNELPEEVEDELMETAVWLLNHIASDTVPGGVSPIEAFRDSLYPETAGENRPDLSYVRMIGSTSFVTFNKGNSP